MTTACASSPARCRRCVASASARSGCYPLTGAVESTADHPARDHPGDAADHDLRAPGARDRPRLERLDGEEEAGGLLLMSPREQRPHRRRHRGLSGRSTSTRSLLRFITCGSVDDGKSTLIGRLLYDSKLVFEDQLAALEARFEEGRHPGRRPRLRPPGRRPRRRARAGHHHRRRLPLLLHRAAQVHRRRHARATSSTPATWSPAPPPPISP